jgi:IclR family transcriptional regulator, acetate operon repressor
MNTIETNEKSQVQVIARAAAILRALENESAGLSLGQIAQRVDLARSTVQRIIAALEIEKLVIAASPNGKMRLGPAILRLAASVRTDFASLARPLLIALSKELGETVDLSTVKKDQVVFIDQVTGPHRLRTVSVVGDAYPLHCTANGKAYLAELDDAAIVDLIGRKYQRRTKNTKVSLSDLIADLRAARQTGVAVDLEEHSLGVCATGVALRDPAGNYVAISVPVPSQRFRDEHKTIARRLLETKAALEKQIASQNL